MDLLTRKMRDRKISFPQRTDALARKRFARAEEWMDFTFR
jgi:hypothetical protein